MTTARDMMHAGAQCVGEDESLMVAAQMMRDLKVGSVPICGNDDRLKGMITDRDITLHCAAEGRNPADVRASELGDGTPYWIDADTDMAQVLQMMEEHQVRRVPVIDDHRLVGMISESDLVRNVTDEQMAHFVSNVYAMS